MSDENIDLSNQNLENMIHCFIITSIIHQNCIAPRQILCYGCSIICIGRINDNNEIEINSDIEFPLFDKEKFTLQ